METEGVNAASSNCSSPSSDKENSSAANASQEGGATSPKKWSHPKVF